MKEWLSEAIGNSWASHWFPCVFVPIHSFEYVDVYVTSFYLGDISEKPAPSTSSPSSDPWQEARDIYTNEATPTEPGGSSNASGSPDDVGSLADFNHEDEEAVARYSGARPKRTWSRSVPLPPIVEESGLIRTSAPINRGLFGSSSRKRAITELFISPSPIRAQAASSLRARISSQRAENIEMDPVMVQPMPSSVKPGETRSGRSYLDPPHGQECNCNRCIESRIL